MQKPVVRAILFFVMFGLVATLPWWLSAVALFALTIYFSLYLEVLFFGFMFDTLYGARGFPHTALTLATAFLLVVTFVRVRIRVYS